MGVMASRSSGHSFAERDRDRIEDDWSAWWAGELERPLVIIEDYVPPPGVPVSDPVDWYHVLPWRFPMGTPADRVLDDYERFLSARRYYGDALPRWWPNFGPGIAAGFLGCDVHVELDTVWFTPVEETDIGDLHLTYDAENTWWRWVKELTVTAEGARTIVREIGGRGFAFCIEQFMGREEAQAFVRSLAAEGAGA
jgi:hypothetical protein